MYPTITIGDIVIDMTGLGIVAALAVFLISTYILVCKSRLQFIKLFYRLPLPLLLIYIMGSYTAFVINQWSRIPTTTNQLYQLISPYGYHFHIIGIMIAVVISLRIFLQKMPSRHERRVWINIIASSISLAMIPLGLWLLLGDKLIGLPTSSFRWMESFRPDISSRSAYGPIYPIGLFIAIIGWLWFITQRLGEKPKRPSGQWYFTLAMMTIAIGLIWTLVNTPKYLVLQTWVMRRDMTTYISIIIAVIFLQQYMIERHRVSNIITTEKPTSHSN